MRKYKILYKNDYQFGIYHIEPIRNEDKDLIRIWRNEQIDILRQSKPLTINEQDFYFKNEIENLFIQDFPKQMLFSFFENGKFIGYGGLVHINWANKTAELSFLNETKRSKDLNIFKEDFYSFLKLIEQIASDLELEKINTYAYNIRDYLYPILESLGYTKEESPKEKIEIGSTLYDIVIHSKILQQQVFKGDNIFLKKIRLDEINENMLDWFKDEELMKYYTNSKQLITKEILMNAIKNGEQTRANFTFGIYYNDNNELIGTIKLGPINWHHKISDLVVLLGNKNYHGKGLAVEAISLGNTIAFKKYGLRKLFGGMYENNLSSIKAYTRAGWVIEGKLLGHYLENDIVLDRILVGCFNPEYFKKNN